MSHIYYLSSSDKTSKITRKTSKISNTLTGKVILSGTLLLISLSAQALSSQEVTFKSGSNCGDYEGDLTGGRIFTLQLRAGQQLVVSGDAHVQSVVDSKGNLLADQGGANYRYTAISSGTHQVKMAGRATSNAEFCID